MVSQRDPPHSIEISREKIGHLPFPTVTAALAFLKTELQHTQQSPKVDAVFGYYYYTPEAISQINSIIGTLNQFKNLEI